MPTVDSYLNSWRRHSVPSAEEYRSRMLLTYPFIPEVLGLILDRVPARGENKSREYEYAGSNSADKVGWYYPNIFYLKIRHHNQISFLSINR